MRYIGFIQNHTINRLSLIDQVSQALKKDIIKAIEADNRFHDVFLKRAGNPEINSVLERIVPKIHRLELAKFGSVEGFQSVEQHEEIILTCKQKDSRTVSSLVEENWLSLGRLLTQQ